MEHGSTNDFAFQKSQLNEIMDRELFRIQGVSCSASAREIRKNRKSIGVEYLNWEKNIESQNLNKYSRMEKSTELDQRLSSLDERNIIR